MSTNKHTDILNQIYRTLEERRNEFVRMLCYHGYEVESGWFNGHYRRSDSGEWTMEYFPIPVISVSKLCDIEIGLNETTVSTKLEREAAIGYSFDKLCTYDFEVFGVENYLSDYYHKGMSLNMLKRNIENSNEKEIGFSFSFSNNNVPDTLRNLIILLQKEGFYY